ncbi:MAG TPA: hypothetical protein VHB46_04360 [Burkholderiales bacterium]|nr:hypothetical protein [Burkholderiales bacterium]
MFTLSKRGALAVAVIVAMLAGCATPHDPDGRIAGNTFGQGVKNLFLAPFMIVAGVAQGLAFLPYTLGTGLTDLNKGLLQANAVSIDDSYRATFGVSIDDKRVDPQSGKIQDQPGQYGRYRSQAIFEANSALQKLLVSQGMPESRAKNYVLAGNYQYAFTRGQILLAVVYRHPGEQSFRVSAKQTGITTTFRPGQRGWHEAYARDVDQQAIDEVIDWAAIDYKLLRQEKIVATLMVLAAEAIKSGKRSPDYWEIERPWMAGETERVMSISQARVSLPST